MTRYKMQILRHDRDTNVDWWADVHPVGGPAYLYDTREEAERMLRVCYPITPYSEARVVEVES